MAGFREFVTGEILTAANVDDFLAKQAVMKFADAAARDTALGTAVASGNALREGMVAWLDDDDSVIAYDGTAWNPVGAEPPAGIGSNVVQTVKTDTFTTSSTTPTDITGLTLTITPSTATSKILLIAQIANGTDTGNQLGYFRLNGGNADDFVGDAAGSRTRTVFGGLTVFSGNNWFGTYIISYLDSPATTSPVNYAVQAWVGSSSAGTARVNFSSDTTDQNNRNRGASSLIAIEVAA
jgi:hypothetical protein